jgi:small GTP-binding protein
VSLSESPTEWSVDAVANGSHDVGARPADADRELERLVSRLGALCDDRPDLAERAARLAERLAAGRFHLAVLGEFKRGKSTLVNALVGQELLPAGVVPLTAVPTEVHLGTTGVTVVLVDGSRIAIAHDELGDFVTERNNPGNVKGVSRVEVGTDEVLGAPGVVLVDTPGVASVNRHNTVAAHSTLAESDGAIVVLSADSPLSESERTILAELGRRGERVFVVINKCDHVDSAELVEIEAYVVEQLRHLLVQWEGPYRTDARGAARPDGAPPTEAVLGVVALREALERFVRDDLASARTSAALAEFARLVHTLDQTLEVEAAAAAMDGETLRARLATLEEAASTGRRALEEDRLVLDDDARTLVDGAGRRVAALARSAAEECRPLVAARAGTVPTRRLSAELRDVVEGCVQERFEPIRRRVVEELDADWEAIAGRFAGRVQGRIRELTRSANDLFRVHLPVVAVPRVTAQRERFSYLFVHIESPSVPIDRLLDLVLAPGLARRRAVRAAERRLIDEFDKHAGRARHDLAQRVDGARQALWASMLAEYDRTGSTLTGAAIRARSLLAAGVDERSSRDRARTEVRALVEAADRLALNCHAAAGPD